MIPSSLIQRAFLSVQFRAGLVDSIPIVFRRLIAEPRRVRYCPLDRLASKKRQLCRKHMMCPVAVANEMSGLKGRVG